MPLTSVQLVKDLLNIAGDGQDALIDMIVEAVSVKVARHCRRYDDRNPDGANLMERAVGAVESPRVVNGKLILRRYPIELVVEVVQSADRDFTGVDPLVEGEDFRIDDNRPDALTSIGPVFLPEPGMVRVTYNGGYVTDGTKPAGAISLPGDLSLAVAQQAAHEFQHRSQFGERSIQVGDMSVAQVKDDLLGIVKQALKSYVNAS
jgi:hypothetical protein